MTQEQLVALLKERGVELDIGACGCCESPWVKVKIDGVEVEEEFGSFSFE